MISRFRKRNINSTVYLQELVKQVQSNNYSVGREQQIRQSTGLTVKEAERVFTEFGKTSPAIIGDGLTMSDMMYNFRKNWVDMMHETNKIVRGMNN